MLVFLFLFVAFTVSAWQYPETYPSSIPKSFAISSLILLCSSFVLQKAKHFFESEDERSLRKHLALALALGSTFCGFQFIGWIELQQAGSFLDSSAVEGYLYVLSGLHMAHLAGGMVFLGAVFWKVSSLKGDPVQSLLYFTDPYQKLRLRILGIYWHFMDALWLVLFIYFLLWL